MTRGILVQTEAKGIKDFAIYLSHSLEEEACLKKAPPPLSMSSWQQEQRGTRKRVFDQEQRLSSLLRSGEIAMPACLEKKYRKQSSPPQRRGPHYWKKLHVLAGFFSTGQIVNSKMLTGEMCTKVHNSQRNH